MKPPAPPSSRPDRDDAHRTDTVLDWARTAGEAERLVANLESLLRRRRRRRAGLALGAALLLGGLAWWPPGRESTASPGAVPAGEGIVVAGPARRTLADGSVAEWEGRAGFEVAFSGTERRVVLREGTVHFQVAKDPARPFVVGAGGIEVRAVGTAFAVELGASAVEVLVTEGRVTVGPAGAGLPASTLAAGGQAILRGEAPPRVTMLSAEEIRRRLAWRVPRLEFAGTPLAEVVARCNEQARRFGGTLLVLADPGLGSQRVSGVLRADDVDSLLRLLEGEFGVTAERARGEIRLRRQ